MQFSALPIGNRTFFIVIHDHQAPGVEAWAALMTALADHKRRHEDDLSSLRLVFVSDGGMADVAMRVELFRLLKTPIPIAVFAEDESARSAVTAMRWADPNARVFSANEVDKALKHLAVSTLETRSVLLPALRILQARHGSTHKVLGACLVAMSEISDRAHPH